MSCHKQLIISPLCEGAVLLHSLKEKLNARVKWSDNDWESLYGLIKETWTLNKSGKNRTLKTPEEYLSHLKQEYEKGDLWIQ